MPILSPKMGMSVKGREVAKDAVLHTVSHNIKRLTSLQQSQKARC